MTFLFGSQKVTITIWKKMLYLVMQGYSKPVKVIYDKVNYSYYSTQG